jgi:hypothetical protein
MKVEIDLPPKAIRMIQALNVLRGKKGGADIESHISKLVMRALKEEIASECDLLNKPAPTPTTTIDAELEDFDLSNLSQDPTEISEGLGDDFDYDGQVEDEGLSIPGPKEGVTDEEVNKDSTVKDPEVEAVVEAPEVENQAEADEHAEETFQQMAFGPKDENEIDQRVAKRSYRNPKARRAKVEGWTGENSSELDLGGGVTV